MTVESFKKLDDIAKYQEILNGTLLSVRQVPGCKIQLYNVYEFYVEVFYCTEKHFIEKVRAFRSTKLIEPYLQGGLQ